MARMMQFRRSRGSVWPLALALLFMAGCSRPSGVPTDGTTGANQAPFQDHGNLSSNSDPHSPLSSAGSGSNGSALPFHDSQTLPAGTLLTVRLNNTITAGNSGGNDSFDATLEKAILVEGNTLVPPGASVAGRVQSSGVSKVKPIRGYVRLALETVHVGSLDVPVHTASLFTRESPQAANPGSTIRLEKGRRLTFRLTEPVFVSFQRAQAGN